MGSLTVRQHWVPRMYLRKWGGDNGLAVATGTKILENQSTINFAQQRYFYRFVDLTSEELGLFYNGVCELWQPNLPLVRTLLVPIVLNVLLCRAEAQDWDDQYKVVFDRIHEEGKFLPIEESVFQHLKNHIEGGQGLTREALAEMKNVAKEGLEKYHFVIEDGSKVCLEAATKGDLSFMKGDADERRIFVIYILNQYFRCPKYIHDIELIDSPLRRRIGATPRLARYFRYFLPILYAARLLAKGKAYKMMVVHNKTPHEFITCDAPVSVYAINEDGLPSMIYLPLSPQSALLYGERAQVNEFKAKLGQSVIDVGKIDLLNHEMVLQGKG